MLTQEEKLKRFDKFSTTSYAQGFSREDLQWFRRYCIEELDTPAPTLKILAESTPATNPEYYRDSQQDIELIDNVYDALRKFNRETT